MLGFLSNFLRFGVEASGYFRVCQIEGFGILGSVFVCGLLPQDGSWRLCSWTMIKETPRWVVLGLPLEEADIDLTPPIYESYCYMGEATC